MKSWLMVLGGLLVWTVHFFGLYAIAETAPQIWLAVALTALCLAADAWLLWRIGRLNAAEPFPAWRRSVALGSAALSLVAVAWQALPVLVSAN